jgi:WD40 repeat protein
VWDIETGQLLQTLEGHQGIIWDIAYSSDDSTLATGGFDSTVKLWDGESGREVLSLDVSERGAPDLAFSPDDRFLAVGGDAARLFVLPVEDLMDLARTRLTRSLYESECRQYLHLDQCPTDP